MAAFKLREDEEESVISFVVGVRHVLRRAHREGYGTDDVLSAYSVALADWPPARRSAVLHAVDALVRLHVPRPAMIPCRLTDDGFDFSGAA